MMAVLAQIDMFWIHLDNCNNNASTQILALLFVLNIYYNE